MILVDTAVWIDHLHHAEPMLLELLKRTQVLGHPMVIGELALGSLRDRGDVLGLLAQLPSATVATHEEVMQLVQQRRLFGQGLSLVDAHLLASTLLTPGANIWTRDKRLAAAAAALDVAFGHDD
ncbi:type II toxin-antitoxin system VapC family toxin [Rathayibacter soli]|uniref:type II toxin-antitoxin system VapC family toxin n=1 Tax=Rathayibacter soli TaxID=3144168 RepID=UPI0027E492C6|nr:type II toxin-antitoxin system VapC family toxin [Glaciibacter superstes]